MLEKILEEIEDLKKAKEILKEIWIDCGPYDLTISFKTFKKIKNYFGSDDSE